MKNIIVTGGAGYIGSHICLALAFCGYSPIIVDNYSNSSLSVIDRLNDIKMGSTPFLNIGPVDVLDTAVMRSLMTICKPLAVIHLAGLKAVGDSVTEPLSYYDANVGGAVSVLKAMRDTGTENFVFSSTATVYGDLQADSLDESMPRSFANPYAHTKIIVEDMLFAQMTADPHFKRAVLRYFNPIGAHPSGKIADQPKGAPMNLMPLVVRAAKGERELTVFGDDYATPDGTCIRDYVHVMDLAAGHVAALEYLLTKGGIIANLGTGNGYSVKEVIDTFQRVNGVQVPHTIGHRRAGDVERLVANPGKAQRFFGWRASLTLDDMCRDAWNARSL